MATRAKSIKRLQRLAKASTTDEYPTSKGYNVKYDERESKTGSRTSHGTPRKVK